MTLTEDNYYGVEANMEYMSVSQFKDFVGTYGRIGCEFCAIEKLEGRWEEEKSTAMLTGNYVDSWFEGTLNLFKAENPDIFRRDGLLRSEFSKAEQIIRRVQKDDYFMRTMSGRKQVIMTGELFGSKWKIKMDSYMPGKFITDLKVMRSITEGKFIKDLDYPLCFIQYWGYDIQGAVYQEIVRQNTGMRLPFFIAAVSKEREPDIRVVKIDQSSLNEALKIVEQNMPRILRVKYGKEEPDRCEMCDCCRKNRVLKGYITMSDLILEI